MTDVRKMAWEAHCAEDPDNRNAPQHESFDAGFNAAVDWARQSLEAMADLRTTTPHTIARATLEELVDETFLASRRPGEDERP